MKFDIAKIVRLKEIYFNSKKQIYKKDYNNRFMNSIFSQIIEFINILNNFNFKKETPLSYFRYLSLLKESLDLLLDKAEVTSKIKSTNSLKKYYSYNNWRRYDFNGKKTYKDIDYFHYLRCLLVAHPVCSFDIPSRKMIDTGEKIIAENQFYWYSQFELDGDEIFLILKVLSDISEYVEPIKINVRDLFDFVNSYYCALDAVIDKIEKDEKNFIKEASKTTIDICATKTTNDYLDDLLENLERKAWLEFKDGIKQIKSTYNYDYSISDEKISKYKSIVDKKLKNLVDIFNQNDYSGFSKILDRIINPVEYLLDYDDLIYFADMFSASSEMNDQGFKRIYNKYIKGLMKIPKTLPKWEKINLVIISAFLINEENGYID